MPNRYGYCSYCLLRYTDLDEAGERDAEVPSSSLMERFLQDVLLHHPYHYQESRSGPNENNAPPAGNNAPAGDDAAPAGDDAAAEVILMDDSASEEMADDAPGARGEIPTHNSEPTGELHSRPSVSQECMQGVPIRPSVIQKLEKGRQKPLEFVYKIGSGLKEFNPVGVGQATNTGKNPLGPSVISTAPARPLPESANARPVITSTARLPVAANLDSVNKCDPNKVDRSLEQGDGGSRNPRPSTSLENSSRLNPKPKESNRKSVCINPDKSVIQEDVKSRGKTLSPGFQSRASMGTEGSLNVESVSKLAVNPTVNQNKTDMPSNKGTFEGAIPKHHEKSFPNMDRTQDKKQVVFNKPASLEQKCSVITKMDFACGSQSVSDQPEVAVQDLCSEGQIDQEDKTYESRASEMSFDCSSSFYSVTDQPKVTAQETNLSEEVHDDLQQNSNESCVSEISSVHDGPLQLATNRIQVIVKGTSVQKAVHVRLVDESYDSSDSEMNFDGDTSVQPTDDDAQQPAEVDLPQEAPMDLDNNYGSGSSEISAGSVVPLQSVIEELPVAVTETEPQEKVYTGLVDMNYGSSCSETSVGCDVSLQSVIVHPQLTVKEGNLREGPVYVNDNNKSSSAQAHLDCDTSLEAVTDEPERAAEEINLPKENNDLMDMNCEYYSPEMNFHTDAQLVAAQPQVAVQEVNPQEAAIDLQNKSANSSVSDLSVNSHASLQQSANEQPPGVLGDINMKESNVDMEVKSYGCSSSEFTFDSDPPLLSVTEHSELNVEEIRKKDINMEDESCGSNSSEMTFNSDIHLCPVVDQPQVAEEEPVDQVNKNNEFCGSEMAFDSNVPLPSETDQSEVGVKEVIIQKEDYKHLGRKNDEPSGSKISLDFYVPPLSVTNSGVLAKRLKLQEEPMHIEPSVSGLSLNYHSTIGHSENPSEEVNLQKDEYVQLKNKGNGPDVPENSLKSSISHSVTHHLDGAVKEINNPKEEQIKDKGNELNVSETRLDFGFPLQSVIQRTDVVLKEMLLQKEKHAAFSGSEINLDSDASHYSVTEPQIAVKEKNDQKDEYVLKNKSDKYSGSEINVLPHLMTEKPQLAVLREDHVDPEVESTKSRGFDINLDIGPPRPSVIEKSQLAPLKKKHVDLENTSSKPSDYKVKLGSNDPPQPLAAQFQDVIQKTNLWEVKDIDLENKVDKPSESKLIQDSDVSPQSVPDQPEAAIKQTNLENEGHVYLEDNNSQYSGSDMSLDSDYLAQSRVDQSQITILEKEHIDLEDKHHKSCGSEISFDSDDPLQSVAEQVRETVKEISLWKDEDVEETTDKSDGFAIMYDSNVRFQSVAGQTEEIIKEINRWKKPVDMEGKIVKPSDSTLNFDSNEHVHSVANEIQEATAEINLLREGHACLHDKGYDPKDSAMIYVSNVHFQPAVEQPHILEEEHANLDDKSNDSCGPEISFTCDDPLQSVADQLEKADKVSLWKEGHIYLGDTYKLSGYQIRCDSDAPVQLVVGQCPVAVKEINLEKKDHNDLENQHCEPSVSGIKCDSGIHLQLEVDHPQMVCKEMNLQKTSHLGMEEKTSDSEIMSDSDVPLQIIVDEFQVSVKEADPQKMLLVDLVTGDSDCEVIADSDASCQPVIDSPQVTVEGIAGINAKSFDLEGACCDCCDSELGYVCEGSPQSESNQSRKTFKVVNQKKDYIILEESACEPYGSEINVQKDASRQSKTHQSPGPDKKRAKKSNPRGRRGKSTSPKRKCNWEETSQPKTRQQRKANKEDNTQKDQKGQRGKRGRRSVSAKGRNASPESADLQMANGDNRLKLKLKLKRTDVKNKDSKACVSGVNIQCDRSFQSDNDRTQKGVKKMSFSLKEMKRDSYSSSGSKGDSGRRSKKAKLVLEDKADEPVLEALPHVPPSFVGKTWSQIMIEDDIKINTLVREFKEGRFHCYFDDDSEPRKVKKKYSSEERKIVSSDLNDTAFIEVLLECDYNVDDFSVALDKPSYDPIEKLPYEQTWRVTSRCQTVKVSSGAQTSLMSYIVTKRVSEHETYSPSLKRLLLRNDRRPKKKIQIGRFEFLESYTNILKPLHPNALFYVVSSNVKLNEGESFNVSEISQQNDKNNQDINIQYKYKLSSFDCYDPLNKKTAINPPLNTEIQESDRNDDWIQIRFSDLTSSEGNDDAHVQSSTSSPFITVSVRHELTSDQGANGSSVFLAKSEILKSSEVPKERNFQLTLLNGDAAKISKSVRNKYLKSKKKVQRRKATTNKKPGLLKKVYRPVVVQEITRTTSEKQSTWIPTKLNDIIRKYISKFSVFLRRKYQSRRAFFGMHFKKTKSVLSRLKKAKRPAKMLSNSIPSADAEKQSSAVKSSSPKQHVQDSSSIAETKRNGGKKRPRRKQKKRPKPVRIYELRSLYSQVPYSHRRMTRLLHKLLLSKANKKCLC
uniref:Zinc finger DBF-type containing 2 n=1 Tax=Myotis myotis TaxID=51298 RepID=A0A7J7WKE0_MYOMY|nr:zinc finger DBF-type containing 2 [Myotis myotis]